jgi:hypothetical protein
MEAAMTASRPLIDPEEIESIVRDARADRADAMAALCRRLVVFVRTAPWPAKRASRPSVVPTLAVVKH